MSDSVRDLLVRGVAAAKADSMEEARFFLEWVLRENCDQEERLEATYWLSVANEDPARKREYLTEILAMEPYNARARRALALLDGRLKAEDVVDPDRLGAAPAGGVPPTVQEAAGLLVQGIAAARERRKEEARALLQRALQGPLTSDQRIQGWIWLTEVCDDLAEKRQFLQQVLRINPEHIAARRGLAVLEQRRLDPPAVPEPRPYPPAGVSPIPSGTPPAADFPVPSAVPPSAEAGQANLLQTVMSRRYVCPQCGGKMAFVPGRNMIRCDYCGQEKNLLQALRSSEVEEQDFTLTLATAKGHSRPSEMKALKCQGCGANFMLTPGLLSMSCAYCGSPHVVELPPQTLLLPQGIVPFGVSEEAAKQAYREWMRREKWAKEAQSTPLRGLYLPMWTFDIGGEARWRCTVNHRNQRAGGVLAMGMLSPVSGLMELGSALADETSRSGVEAVFYDDLRVPASHGLPPDLLKTFDDFILEQIAPYDPRYLADWPAEIYQVSVSDASLVARSRGLETCRRKVEIQISATIEGETEDINVSSAGIVVESYKLLLVPVWLVRYRLRDETYMVVINGQTQDIRGQKPAGGLKKFLGGLLG